MITSLHLKNFQSHVDTALEFTPGINAIVGSTDSGKSAIIRALTLCIENKPSGDAFITHGFDSTEVSLVTDSHTIIRKKGKENSYIVDGKVLKAFGVSVPEEVSQALGIDPVISIAKQSSPYFLLHAGGSERNALLSEFAGMAVATAAVSIARREVLQASKQADAMGAQAKKLTAKLAILTAFESEKPRVANIREQEQSLGSNQRRLDALTCLFNKLSRVDAVLARVAPYGAAISASLVAISGLHDVIAPDIQRHHTLTSLYAKLQSSIPSLISIPELELSKAPFEKLLLLNKYRKILDKVIPREIHTPAIDTSFVNEKKLQKLKQLQTAYIASETTEKEKELVRCKKDLSEFKVCPLCNSSLKRVS